MKHVIQVLCPFNKQMLFVIASFAEETYSNHAERNLLDKEKTHRRQADKMSQFYQHKT